MLSLKIFDSMTLVVDDTKYICALFYLKVIECRHFHIFTFFLAHFSRQHSTFVQLMHHIASYFQHYTHIHYTHISMSTFDSISHTYCMTTYTMCKPCSLHDHSQTCINYSVLIFLMLSL